MALPTDILLVYGYLLIFAWVLIEQLGVPLPSVPVLLAAGALSAQKQISFFSPDSQILIANLKLNPKGIITSSHLLMDEGPSDIAMAEITQEKAEDEESPEKSSSPIPSTENLISIDTWNGIY